jgi:hypothetical protein
VRISLTTPVKSGAANRAERRERLESAIAGWRGELERLGVALDFKTLSVNAQSISATVPSQMLAAVLDYCASYGIQATQVRKAKVVA